MLESCPPGHSAKHGEEMREGGPAICRKGSFFREKAGGDSIKKRQSSGEVLDTKRNGPEPFD